MLVTLDESTYIIHQYLTIQNQDCTKIKNWTGPKIGFY